MSTTLTRPPDAEALDASPGGLAPSSENQTPTLASLPVGARLVLRCRKDWRTATVAAFETATGRVVLNVASPSGHTYRLRRPSDSPLAFDGAIPVLGDGSWRVGLVRYDVRW